MLFRLNICIVLIFICSAKLKAQEPRYIISLKDKQNKTYSLSQRATEKRTRQHIPLDSTDFSVNPVYIDSIAKAGNIKVLYTSRWFNYVAIQTSDDQALEKIRHYSFVSSTNQTGARVSSDKRIAKQQISDSASLSSRDADLHIYGKAATQIHLHEGEYLHNNKYQGENMLIAVLDAGFPAVDKNRAFSDLHITGTYDFVNSTKNVDGNASHGAECLSILASKLPGEMTGTAPEANYLLLRTEDNESEQPIEENNWEAAVEYADSAGADVISSSLGYNTFDPPFTSHNYSQFDGHTTMIARASAIATLKGMIIVCTAGNEGDKDWKYILSPADADNILSVGAVNKYGVMAAFSGRGPTADGRIKPDVVSLGINTYFVNTSGTVTPGSGTSFASPVIAGLTACLWQAFPERSNLEIIQAIKAGSSQYITPDNNSGYGIPNFHTAFDILLNKQWQDSSKIAGALNNSWIKAFPNPFTDRIKLYLHNTDGKAINLLLYNSMGQLVKQSILTTGSGYVYAEWPEDLSELPVGIYFLQAKKGNKKSTIQLLKI
jgi:subtilisin family serine protease